MEENKKYVTMAEIKEFLNEKYEWEESDLPVISEIKRRAYAPIRFYRTCDNDSCDCFFKGFCFKSKKECSNKIIDEKDEILGKKIQHVSLEKDENVLDEIASLKVMLVHADKALRLSQKQQAKLEVYARECEKEALEIKKRFEDAKANGTCVEPCSTRRDEIFEMIAKDWVEFFGDKTPRQIREQLDRLKNHIKGMSGQNKTMSEMQIRINNLHKMLEERDNENRELKDKLNKIEQL